jgi:hypothetical protein
MAAIRAFVGLTVLASVPFLLWAQPRSSPSLQGVWRAEEMVWVGGPSPRTAKNPQPYFRIYAGKHFSLVGVMSDQPRRMLAAPKNPTSLTDAEKVARYEHWLPFHGQSGTYEIKGSQVVHRWQVGKGTADTDRVQTHDYKLDGPNTLWLFNREGANGAEFNVRYTRLE